MARGPSGEPPTGRLRRPPSGAGTVLARCCIGAPANERAHTHTHLGQLANGPSTSRRARCHSSSTTAGRPTGARPQPSTTGSRVWPALSLRVSAHTSRLWPKMTSKLAILAADNANWPPPGAAWARQTMMRQVRATAGRRAPVGRPFWSCWAALFRAHSIGPVGGGELGEKSFK